MNTLEKTLAQEFAEQVAKQGPCFVYGHLSAPYDGCFHLNVVAFVEGDYAYLMTDLKDTRQARHLTEAPAERRNKKLFHAGCVKFSDLETVLCAPNYNSGLEIHPLAELAENTPYALYGHAVAMAQELGYNVAGQFKCKACGYDFANGGEPMYLQGDFKGNGGIGIEVGAPVCDDCYNKHTCAYCGEEGEPEGMELDDSGHCKFCAPQIICPVSGEAVKPDYDSSREVLDAYRQGMSVDGAKALEYVKAYEDNASGDLFRYR